MQAIAVKAPEGEIYFLGLKKKAVIAPSDIQPKVDEEWEVEIVEEHCDYYLVKPIKKLSKETFYQIESIYFADCPCRDELFLTTAVGERIIKKEHVKTLKAIKDCFYLNVPIEIKKKLIRNRMDWEKKKKVLLSIIPWFKDAEGSRIFEKFGIKGTITSVQKGRRLCNYFETDSIVIEGPSYNIYEKEDREIGRMLIRGRRLEIIFDREPEGFLLNFFEKTKVRCGEITVPIPEGLYRKADIEKYFIAKAREGEMF